MEFLLLYLYLHAKKRITNNSILSKNDNNLESFRKYWWIYLIGIITIPLFIYYIFSYENDIFELVGLIVPIIVDPYFIIKKPVSTSGVFSIKFEYILGVSMFITGVLRLGLEVFL